jgi:hypothetical protein
MNLESTRETLLEAYKASLAAYCPERFVRRGLVDPVSLPLDQLQAGVLCITATGGGKFANYLGREGEFCTVKLTITGFVQVEERPLSDDPDAAPVLVESAEHALLEEVIGWIGAEHSPPQDPLYPIDYTQSGGLVHPMGWFALRLEARNV